MKSDSTVFNTCNKLQVSAGGTDHDKGPTSYRVDVHEDLQEEVSIDVAILLSVRSPPSLQPPLTSFSALHQIQLHKWEVYVLSLKRVYQP